jgi:hypothetical protein
MLKYIKQRGDDMWALIASSVGKIFTSWVDLKKTKNEAEAAYHMKALSGELDWDIEAQKQAQYSWKDEFITVIWFSPLIVAWFDEDKALAWVNFAQEMPYWYQIGMFGIIAASFGLRWYFKSQAFKVTK